MKKAFAILLLLITTATLSAQTEQPKKKWIRLGVDRDTLAYIIASPFDNWWVNFSVGFQTFIGNEQDADARWNYKYHGKLKLDNGARIEIGKWIIPDLAISLRVNSFSFHSQGLYNQNPWLDKTDPSDAESFIGPNTPYYWQFAHGISISAHAYLDWTNLLHGYERGKRRHLHFYTPVGMGGAWLYAKQINDGNKHPDFEMGDMRKNKELTFNAGIMAEYYATRYFSFNLGVDVTGTRGTIDWTYAQDMAGAPHKYRVVDWIPAAYLGVKLNFLRDMFQFNSETNDVDLVHDKGFSSYGSHNYLSTIPARIDDLYRQKDSLENLADDLGRNNAAEIDRINKELDDLKKQLSERPVVHDSPTNLLSELILMNETLNLPATIIYFQLDKYDIDYNARKRLSDFAREMNKLDDTVEFYLIGAADSLTGSIPHNKWLSGKRCGVTYNMLTKDFGVDGNQLIQVPLGGITEYEPQENNRMAMLIMRTPVTEEIVERWTKKRN